MVGAIGLAGLRQRSDGIEQRGDGRKHCAE
jgi:hypothetical protein